MCGKKWKYLFPLVVLRSALLVRVYSHTAGSGNLFVFLTDSILVFSIRMGDDRE